MQKRYIKLFIISLLITSAAFAVAAGIEGETSSQIQQSNKSHLEQLGTQQHNETNKDWQKLQDPVSRQAGADTLLDRDQDRLRDLEQEITEEQLTVRDRDKDCQKEHRDMN